jgi:hypothetical protein
MDMVMIVGVVAVIVAYMCLAFVSRLFEQGCVSLRGVGRFWVRIAFEGVGSAQRFAFRAQTPRQQSTRFSCCSLADSWLQSTNSGLQAAGSPSNNNAKGSKITPRVAARAQISYPQKRMCLISW